MMSLIIFWSRSSNQYSTIWPFSMWKSPIASPGISIPGLTMIRYLISAQPWSSEWTRRGTRR